MHDVLSPRAASKNNPVDRSVNDRLLPSFALNQLHLVTKITPFWHRHQRNKIDQIQIIEITPQTRNINAPSRQNQKHEPRAFRPEIWMELDSYRSPTNRDCDKYRSTDQQPPVKRVHVVYRLCSKRQSRSDRPSTHGSRRSAANPLETCSETRGTGMKSVCTGVHPSTDRYLRETATDQLVEEVPGKSAFRSLSLVFLRETNMAVRYQWSCDGSTSLLPYRTRKSILLLPTNTEAFSSKLALSRPLATISSEEGCTGIYIEEFLSLVLSSISLALCPSIVRPSSMDLYPFRLCRCASFNGGKKWPEWESENQISWSR